MTEKTKVIGIRVPTEVYEALKGVNLRDIITDIAENGIRENDPDGEWVREMAHRFNVDVKTFKNRVERMG